MNMFEVDVCLRMPPEMRESSVLVPTRFGSWSHTCIVREFRLEPTQFAGRAVRGAAWFVLLLPEYLKNSSKITRFLSRGAHCAEAATYICTCIACR